MRILVLNASGLHLGYIGCYGNDWVDTPNLDRLAAEGIVFDQHFADCPKALDGRDAHLTGRYRFPIPGAEGITPQDPSVPAILESHGVNRLILAAPDLDAIQSGLKKWARWKHGLLWVDWPSLAPPWNVPADFLDGYFAVVEDEEPLEPWNDPPTGPFDTDGPDLERLMNTYAARVTFFDAQLGALIDDLDRRTLLDDVMLCVTAASGFALGEHGYSGAHRAWLHEEVVHVPLIIRMPGAAEAGLRVAALTQPLDMPATIMDALALPSMPTDGHSMMPLVRGGAEPLRSHACSGLEIGTSLEWALRTPESAFLLPLTTPPDDPPRQPQLFVKPDDRWEVNDVRHQNLELAEELEQTLRDFVTSKMKQP